jgi:exodeoxyribonuclease V alpha subunit
MLEPESSIDNLAKAFAAFLSQKTCLTSPANQAFETIVTALIRRQNQGHNCLEIDAQTRALLLASGVANPSDQQSTPMPLVIDGHLLYLQRYWAYENCLAQQIKAKLNQPGIVYSAANDQRVEQALNCFFESGPSDSGSQRAAAKLAMQQAFSIITGGPGTGKTTTVVKILALIQHLSDTPLLMALAAPTGKAAKRLQESVGRLKMALPCSETVKALIPDNVSTLHQLLGARPPTPYFRHNADNPLIYDVIVVDEASMIDLALMSKLFNALRPKTNLILLGDKDQLASVESGSVLADLSQIAALQANVCTLTTSHRFDESIMRLANAINLQQAETAWEIVQANPETTIFPQAIADYAAQKYQTYLQMIATNASIDELFQAFGQFQVLCSNRHGRNGVSDVNHRIEQKLAALKLVHPQGPWYCGRPVIITQNDHSLQLYNGDLGICLPSETQNGKLMVCFQQSNGPIKRFLPSQMPPCETAYALTIHKSQGSEFDEVLIALPDVMHPLLTKELLYTAITRAKKSVRLATSEAVLKGALKQKTNRTTGLANQFAKEALAFSLREAPSSPFNQ